MCILNIDTLLFLFLNFLEVSFACIGYMAPFAGTGAGGSYSGRQDRSSSNAAAQALAAPNARLQASRDRLLLDGDGVAKCQRTDIGVYKATELRKLATLYEFPVGKASTSARHGGQLSCNFDTPDEHCAWYTLQWGQHSKEVVRRARFESLFDWEKFDCTSDRAFTFDEYFIILGGRENSVEEISGAIETKIPCQLEKATLRFDYWSNNETPVLKICIISADDPKPQCEETKLDANPLTFEIPESAQPFRLRIQIDHIAGRDDVAFIDNVNYQGKLCGITNKDGTTNPITSHPTLSSTTAIASLDDYEIIETSSSIGMDVLPKKQEELSSKPPAEENSNFMVLSRSEGKAKDEEEEEEKDEEKHEEKDEENDDGAEESGLDNPTADAYSDQQANEQAAEEEERRLEIQDGEVHYGGEKLAKIIENECIQAKTKIHKSDNGHEGLCRALNCEFNFGDPCAYKLNGQGSTDPWKIGTGPVGNPHTGIHKGGPGDPKLIGYLYVGRESAEASSDQQVFVLESAPFSISGQSILLTFNLFQRSVGPELKVCLNTLDHCPYKNPSKPNKSKYWLTDQRVILRHGTEKIFFVASKLRPNLYLAIDNIQLQTIGFKNICRTENDGEGGIPAD